jgi:hypothetical protein
LKQFHDFSSFSPTDSPGGRYAREIFMLSASQEIYSRRFRPVFLNRGKLFEGQYGGVAIRMLVNIDRCSLIAHGWGGRPHFWKRQGLV